MSYRGPEAGGAAAPASPFQRYARWALYGGLLLGCALAFNPQADRLPTVHSDKFQHLAAFVSLTLAAWWAHPGARWRAVAGLLLFGVFIEVVQMFIPGRSAEWGDLVADALGIALGVLVARFSRRTAG